jgi:hypothetical protein
MSHATYVHVERRKLVGDRDGGGRATGTEGEKRESARKSGKRVDGAVGERVT